MPAYKRIEMRRDQEAVQSFRQFGYILRRPEQADSGHPVLEHAQHPADHAALGEEQQ